MFRPAAPGRELSARIIRPHRRSSRHGHRFEESAATDPRDVAIPVFAFAFSQRTAKLASCTQAGYGTSGARVHIDRDDQRAHSGQCTVERFFGGRSLAFQAPPCRSTVERSHPSAGDPAISIRTARERNSTSLTVRSNRAAGPCAAHPLHLQRLAATSRGTAKPIAPAHIETQNATPGKCTLASASRTIRFRFGNHGRTLTRAAAATRHLFDDELRPARPFAASDTLDGQLRWVSASRHQRRNRCRLCCSQEEAALRGSAS